MSTYRILRSARIAATCYHHLLLSYPIPAASGRQQGLLRPNYLSLVPRKLFASVPEKDHAAVGEKQGSALKKGFGFKHLWDKYGYLSIGFYVSLYLTTLSSIFVALDFDLFRASTFGLDPIESVKKFCDIVENGTGSTKLPGFIRENPRVGTFAIAWIMTKFTEPFRFAITLAVIPSIARLLGRETSASSQMTMNTSSTATSTTITKITSTHAESPKTSP